MHKRKCGENKVDSQWSCQWCVVHLMPTQTENYITIYLFFSGEKVCSIQRPGIEHPGNIFQELKMPVIPVMAQQNEADVMSEQR